jgi:hypothetical protein
MANHEFQLSASQSVDFQCDENFMFYGIWPWMCILRRFWTFCNDLKASQSKNLCWLVVCNESWTFASSPWKLLKSQIKELGKVSLLLVCGLKGLKGRIQMMEQPFGNRKEFFIMIASQLTQCAFHSTIFNIVCVCKYLPIKNNKKHISGYKNGLACTKRR